MVDLECDFDAIRNQNTIQQIYMHDKDTLDPEKKKPIKIIL